MMQSVRRRLVPTIHRASRPFTFLSPSLQPELVRALAQLDIVEPNEIQAEALPIALGGEDLMVCARTGMGKTLIFLLPMLHRLKLEKHPPQGPEALVLVPTDELAVQVAAVAEKLTAELPEIGIACMSADDCFSAVATSRLLVGTPRRVLPLVADGRVDPEAIRMVAVDEADALYTGELGEQTEEEINLELYTTTGEESSSLDHALKEHAANFSREEEINFGAWSATGTAGQQSEEEEEGSEKVYAKNVSVPADAVLSLLPSSLPSAEPPAASIHRRQTILTMATVGAVHDARLRRHFPRAVRVSHAGVMPPSLRQRFHLISMEQQGGKPAQLLKVLKEAAEDDELSGGQAMVFCTEASLAAEVHTFLNQHAAERGNEGKGECVAERALLLSEATPAAERASTVAAIARGEARLLVCTDVASRGLDFPRMRHVIMYDLPRDVAAFIHRAGRTARQGTAGMMSCLVQAHEVHLMRELHQGESIPGTALHRAAGRAGIAALAERAKKPEQRGWLSKGDLAMAERSMAVGTPKPSGGSSKPSSDFAGLVDEEGKAPDGGTVGGRTWMP